MSMQAARFVFAVAAAVALQVAPARAEVVVAQGVELQLPAGWKAAGKGPVTVLAPTKYKGRAVEIIKVKAMPAATTEALQGLQKLFKREKLTITKVLPVERNGLKMVGAEGTLATAKGAVAIDLLVVPTKDAAALLLSFTKADQDPILRRSNTELLLSVRVPGPRMSVHYTAPQKPGVVGAPKEFVAALGKLVAFLDGKVRLPNPLPVVFKECGMANAFYSPSKHAITLCHEYFDYRYGLFKKAGLDEAKARESSSGAMAFSFMHEFGHALHHELGLPITGRGEDAADEIAAVWLAQLGPSGKKIAMLAARAHYENSKLPTHEDAYWDEHSLSLQRVAAILCLLYGSDAKAYAPIMKAFEVNPNRLAKCKRDYPLRVKAWVTLLKPHLTKTR